MGEGEICVLGYIFAVQQKYQRTTYELSKMRATLQGQDGQLRELAVDSLEDDEHVVAAKGLMDGNDFLAQFWDQLPRTKTEEDIPLKNPLCFDHLFEAQSRMSKARRPSWIWRSISIRALSRLRRTLRACNG